MKFVVRAHYAFGPVHRKLEVEAPDAWMATERFKCWLIENGESAERVNGTRYTYVCTLAHSGPHNLNPR
jgi:hypothetical protein